MLAFIVALLLHTVCYFLVLYAMDKPEAIDELCDNPFPITIDRPSLKDLQENTEEVFVQEYFREVVLPSEHYYYLKDCLSKYIKSNSDFDFATLLLPFSTFLFIQQSFRRLHLTETKFLLFLIPLGIAVLIAVIVRLFYNKLPYFKPYKCRFDILNIDDLKKNYNNDIEMRWIKAPFYISEQTHFNNYIISVFTSYMEEVAHTIHVRYALRKSLAFIAGVIYFVFFFSIPDL